MNDYISTNSLWDLFPTLRSMNDHGRGKLVKGIQPKYFKIICKILNITGDYGDSLKDYTAY